MCVIVYQVTEVRVEIDSTWCWLMKLSMSKDRSLFA